MPWEKGQSGNPDGRTKKAMHIMRQMEGLTFKAVRAYETALDEGSVSEKLAAANAVMDRVMGKPKSQTSIAVTHNASPHLAALVELASATASRVIEHQPDTSTLQLIGESATVDVEMSEETS